MDKESLLKRQAELQNSLAQMQDAMQRLENQKVNLIAQINAHLGAQEEVKRMLTLVTPAVALVPEPTSDPGEASAA